MRRTIRRVGLLAALAAGATGCAHGTGPRETRPGMYALVVNGATTHVPLANTLLEALARTPHAALATGVLGADGAPLYLIDGVPVHNGLAIIRTMRVCEAAAIQVLRPLHAVTRWGSGASAGAVVVTTRRADTPGSC